MQFCCLLGKGRGSCGEIACSLFVVSLTIADLFSFLSAFMPLIFCIVTTMTLSSHLADLFPSFAFEFAHFLLWFCPSSTSLRQMDSESFVSVGLNHLNKNRERYMDLSKCILLLIFSNSLKWNTTWKLISKYLESLQSFDDIISSNNQWILNNIWYIEIERLFV